MPSETASPAPSAGSPQPSRRTARLALCLCAALVPAAGAAPLPLPEIGDPSATVLTPAKERRLGEALLDRLRRENKLVEDLAVNGYVESLGNRLAAESGIDPSGLTFFIVRDRKINAFAAPGGMIGINAGLIVASRSESELAGVLAHEIAHVSQRHMARTFEAAGRMQIPVAVGVLAAILLGAANPEAGQAALAGTLAGSAQQQIDFIRSNEQEADRIGIQILADAGFDPNGMPDFFARLERMQRLYGDVVPEFLRTHPVNVNRIASARDRVRQLPSIEPREESEYRLIRYKTLVLSRENDDELIAELRRRIDDGEDGARYALALALVERGRPGPALEALEPLLAAEPDRPEYLGLQAEALAASGRTERAAELYRDVLSIYPGHRALTLDYASLLLNLGRPGDARRLLEDELRDGRESRGIHRLLSHAYFKLGEEVDGRWHRAEWLRLDGRQGEAAEELRRALDAADPGSYQAARIAARLGTLEAELDGPQR